jgi:hypothetical protein
MVILDLANPTPCDVISSGAAAASNSFFMEENPEMGT